MQRFAKPPSGVTCFEGSNPSLSAIHPRSNCARSSVDRASGCGPEGRGFESRRARHLPTADGRGVRWALRSSLTGLEARSLRCSLPPSPRPPPAGPGQHSCAVACAPRSRAFEPARCGARLRLRLGPASLGPAQRSCVGRCGARLRLRRLAAWLGPARAVALSAPSSPLELPRRGRATAVAQFRGRFPARIDRGSAARLWSARDEPNVLLLPVPGMIASGT